MSIRIIPGKKAQAAVEYALILACVALVCMAGAKVFHLMLLQCYKNFVFMISIPLP